MIRVAHEVCAKEEILLGNVTTRDNVDDSRHAKKNESEIIWRCSDDAGSFGAISERA